MNKITDLMVKATYSLKGSRSHRGAFGKHQGAIWKVTNFITYLLQGMCERVSGQALILPLCHLTFLPFAMLQRFVRKIIFLGKSIIQNTNREKSWICNLIGWFHK